MYTNFKVILYEDVDQYYESLKKSFNRKMDVLLILGGIGILIFSVAAEHEAALVDLSLSSDMGAFCSDILDLVGISFVLALFAGLSHCLKSRYSYIPKAIELSKEIADGNLTIQQVDVDRQEIICKDRNGKIEVIKFTTPFKEKFEMYAVSDLQSKEIIVDLSGGDIWVHM